MTGVRAEQCPAKAKRSGKRCSHLVRGGGVCPQHGGNAPQVKRKRLERLTVAEALLADPRRHPAEVLADVGHQADYLMRRARNEIDTGTPTADTMARLVDLADRAGQWAKTGLDAGVAERQTRVQEAQAAVMVSVMRRVLDRLDLTPAQHGLVSVVVPEEFERAGLEGSESDS